MPGSIIAYLQAPDNVSIELTQAPAPGPKGEISFDHMHLISSDAAAAVSLTLRELPLCESCHLP